jgi:hypothetical protein
MMRLSFAELVGAGARAIARYTGTLFAVFLVQALLAAACMLGVAFVLAQAYANLPLFDDAVDGDLAALVRILLAGGATNHAVLGVVFGALFVWLVVSWFLAGGIYGVLAHRPETRAETARVFGHAGAQTFLAYARLAALSLPGLAIAATVFITCAQYASPRILDALTLPQLIGPLTLAVLPAAIVLHVVWTISDYARVELSLRYATHRPSALITYMKTIAFVLRRPMLLVHGAFGWVLFALVTVAYALIAMGRPMYGPEGAITLFIARSCVSLLRMAIRVGVMGGQVEAGRTRELPPMPADDEDAPAPAK